MIPIILGLCFAFIIILLIRSIFFRLALAKLPIESNSIGLVEFVHVGVDDEEVTANQIDRYFEVIEHYVSSARQSIISLEYWSNVNIVYQIGNTKNAFKDDTGRLVLDGYNGVMNAIKSRTDNGVSYIKIIQFSTAIGKIIRNNGQVDPFVELVKLAFPSTIDHMIRLWNSNSKFDYRVIMVPEAAILYNMHIIDDKYVISEYSRKDAAGNSLPDVLYVDNFPLQRVNRKKLVNSLIKKNRAVTQAKLAKAIEDALEQANQNKTYVSDRMKILRKISQVERISESERWSLASELVRDVKSLARDVRTHLAYDTKVLAEDQSRQEDLYRDLQKKLGILNKEHDEHINDKPQEII
jgi:hypothetical protein